jgi:hypothetical protein
MIFHRSVNQWDEGLNIYLLFYDSGQFGVLRCDNENYCSFNISSRQSLQNFLSEIELTHASLLS